MATMVDAGTHIAEPAEMWDRFGADVTKPLLEEVRTCETCCWPSK